MLKKYNSLKEFCEDNSYSFNSLLTVDDTYYIANLKPSNCWHVGKYCHNKHSYDVELKDIHSFKTLEEATALLGLLLKEPS